MNMSALYKYICPKCHNIDEDRTCTLETVLPSSYYREYRCRSCHSSFMYNKEMIGDDYVCSMCGEFNALELYEGICSNCGTRMNKLYCIPTYPNVGLKRIDGIFFYSGLLGDEKIEVEDYEIVNEYLRKFSILSNGIKLWGLVNNDDILVLTPKYDSITIDNNGNIFVIFPLPNFKERDPFTACDIRDYVASFEIDIAGNPILRTYNEKRENIETVVFPDLDAIRLYGDFAISVKNGKMGIVNIKGDTIVEPIYDTIDKHFIAYNKERDLYTSIFPSTFGEGLVCAEDYDKQNVTKYGKIYGWPNLQYFMDKRGCKQIVFDQHWANRNNIDIKDFRISPSTTCHFQNGILKVDCAIDEYYGRIYEVDKLGNAKDVDGIDYKEFPLFDPIEDIDYNGYEEMGYWGVDDEGLRDALDDEPEASGNID